MRHWCSQAGSWTSGMAWESASNAASLSAGPAAGSPLENGRDHQGQVFSEAVAPGAGDYYLQTVAGRPQAPVTGPPFLVYPPGLEDLLARRLVFPRDR